MGKNKESFRDELAILAKISNDIESSILSKGEVKIVIELKSEDFKKIIENFADIHSGTDKFSIEISGVNFTFVLKK